MAIFLIGLAPVLGFVGYSEVYAFDNYVCIPMIGLVLALAAGMRAATHKLAALEIPAYWTLAPAMCAIGIGWIAVDYSYLAKWRTTESAYLHMLSLEPRLLFLKMNLANHYFAQGQFSDAQTYDNNPLAFKPAAAWGEMLLQLGRPAQAIEHLQVAVALSPGDLDLLNKLGNALMSDNRLAETETIWRRMIELAPDLAAGHGNLASLLGMQGRPADALPHAERAAMLDPNHPTYQLNLGSIYAQFGRFDEAVPRLRRAVELDDTNLQVMEQLAVVHLQMNQPEEARSVLMRCLATNPRRARAHLIVGESYRMQGDLQSAIAAYRRAVEDDPTSAEAHFARGMSLREIGSSVLSLRKTHHQAAVSAFFSRI